MESELKSKRWGDTEPAIIDLRKQCHFFNNGICSHGEDGTGCKFKHCCVEREAYLSRRDAKQKKVNHTKKDKVSLSYPSAVRQITGNDVWKPQLSRPKPIRQQVILDIKITTFKAGLPVDEIIENALDEMLEKSLFIPMQISYLDNDE